MYIAKHFKLALRIRMFFYLQMSVIFIKSIATPVQQIPLPGL